jgi:hypothetical protein
MRRMTQTLSLLLLISISVSSASAYLRSEKAEPHTDWVAYALKQMQSIRVGMSREEILRIFKEGGGISTRRWRRYECRECPYIKVDVEFEPVEAKED